MAIPPNTAKMWRCELIKNRPTQRLAMNTRVRCRCAGKVTRFEWKELNVQAESRRAKTEAYCGLFESCGFCSEGFFVAGFFFAAGFFAGALSSTTTFFGGSVGTSA